jgi:flavin reductase (DIM6/NTAB) family NADH-FMN oxidoreductase RutF
MNDFECVGIDDIPKNVFSLLNDDWMLIAAGNPGRFNAKTASWGGFGVLWNKKVAFIFVRPTRHTFGFLEGSPTFTLSFFPDNYRSALNYIGSHSGRDGDKIKTAGLTPRLLDAGGITFEEARLAITCKKLYSQDIDPSRFADPALMDNYPARDFHRMFVGEIFRCVSRKPSPGGSNS